MRGYSSEILLKTSDLLLENGIKPSFKATLSLKNLKLLPDIWKSYYELYKKYDFISYSPTLDTTDNDVSYLNDWEESLREIIKYELTFLRENGRPLWFWFRENEKINCATENRLHMHNDGNFYICHGCPYINNNEKFILGNTKNNTIIELLTQKCEENINPICNQCEATYCSVCHILNIKNDCQNVSDVYKKWNLCRHQNENKCKYYKIFAKYSRILKTAYLKG